MKTGRQIPVVGHLYVRAGKAFAMELDYLQLRHFKNSHKISQWKCNISYSQYYGSHWDCNISGLSHRSYVISTTHSSGTQAQIND